MRLLLALEGVLLGGGEHDILRMTRELERRGHGVVIGASGAAMLDAARDAGATSVQLPGGLPTPFALAALRRVLAEQRIDAINAHSIRKTMLCGVARRLGLVSVPVLTTIHDVHDRSNDRVAYHVLRALPDALTFISHHEQQRLAGGRPLIGRVLHTGIEIPDPKAVAAVDLQAALGIAPGARVVGFVGRLSPEKGLHDAVAALTSLPDDTVLCLIGSGPEEASLRADVERRGLADRALFAGYQDDVLGWMKACDVILLPSHRESLPVTLREAAAIERPVVASDVGGIAEIVLDGETGLLFPPKDVGAMARALARVLADADAAAAMGRAGRARVAERFGIERWIDETLALLAELGA